jgi:diguanylate cyclase (GGDEF)-like protein
MLGSGLIGAYFLVPAQGSARDVLYAAIGLVSAGLMVLGVRRHRPDRPALWYCFAAGQTIWVFGDITWTVYQDVLHEEPFPSVADAFYLSAYPILATGLLMLVRGRAGGRDRADLIDAGTIATGLALLFWTFVMRPIAADASLSSPADLIALAYPTADVVLLALLARLYTSAGVRTASYRLLAAAVVLLLGSDVGFLLITAVSDYDGGLLDIGWLLSYVLWGAAALHPSMRSMSVVSVVSVVSAAEPADRTASLSRTRQVVLVITCMLAPVLLLLQGLRRPEDIDWLAIGVGAVLLFLLMLARMSGLLHRVVEQARRMTALALRDELTGLPSRRLLRQRIGAALAQVPAHRVHVALIDLRDFKDVNDRLGHAVGDALLIAVGMRLGAALRPQDVLARLGGDEYGLLIVDADAAEAAAVIDNVRHRLREPISVADHQLLVHVSVGVADGAGIPSADGDGDGAVEILRRADVARYAAKDGGSAVVRYWPELDARVTEHARLGANLREALDEGRFELMYQPIVTLPLGELVGVEALVRWRHPVRGLVGPVDFIPVMERNGLITELGQWILQEACRQAAAWHDQYGAAAPRRVSVNVSARQLRQPGFADQVAATLAETRWPADRLVLEVTETAVFGGGPVVAELTAIRKLGVRIALDDFGTGHSSLGLLNTCPVDILKVDKTFVDGITLADRHSVIAAALVDITNGLNLTAVAEGLETAEQAAEIYKLGYRYAQGYHYGRPMDAGALAVLLQPVTATAPIGRSR